MMIRQVVEYRQGAIELLGKDDAHHLVREGHARERYFALCSGIHGIGETVGTTDDEHQSFGYGVHALLQPVGKSYGSELLAALVEEDDVVAWL